FLFMQFYLAWFCLILLFFILEETNLKQSVFYSFLYGIITAVILFYWVIPVASKYSGTFTFHSLLLYGAAVIYFSLYFGLFGIGYKLLQRSMNSLLLSGVSVSGFYVLIELTRMSLFPGLPWFHYNLAVTQAQNNWAIQWGSVGGIYIIIFIIVLFNYLLAQYLMKKERKLLIIAATVPLIFWGVGFLLNYTKVETGDNKFTAVLLNENISAETRWNDQTGDSLANVFFSLNKKAVEFDPDIIIWSETAIPWKFEPDDNFIPKVLSITCRIRADHLFGILSPSIPDDKQVYNSAYLIKRDGKIMDRYDKTILLDFLEKPFSNGALSVLPFVNISRYENVLSGRKQNVIKSGKAIIGVLICNESLCGEIYAKYINENANLFVSMSNDAWFENTMLQIHHFYITRLYAVMTGRDIIVNSNRGITGLIRSSGDIEALPHSESARTISCEANLYAGKTIYSGLKNLTIPFYLFLTFYPIFFRRHQKNENYI
ncbi:MAG: apolipoprotein N-acyltransferase, partial [Methanococcaceae archaeon]